MYYSYTTLKIQGRCAFFTQFQKTALYAKWILN